MRELRACLRVCLLLFLAAISILLSGTLRARLATAGGAVLAHRIFEFYFALLRMLVQLLESQEVLLVQLSWSSRGDVVFVVAQAFPFFWKALADGTQVFDEHLVIRDVQSLWIYWEAEATRASSSVSAQILLLGDLDSIVHLGSKWLVLLRQIFQVLQIEALVNQQRRVLVAVREQAALLLLAPASLPSCCLF